MSNEKNEIMATEASTYLTDPVNLNELFSEELDGLRPSFERIKIPAGGGISYEVPGDDPDRMSCGSFSRMRYSRAAA